MRTREVIELINGNGGLDLGYCRYCAKQEGITVVKYITEYVKAYYECSRYVAKKVARYFA